MRSRLALLAGVLLAAVAVLIGLHHAHRADESDELALATAKDPGAPPIRGLDTDPRLRGRVDPPQASAGEPTRDGASGRIQVLGEVLDAETGEPLAGVRVRLGRVPPVCHASASCSVEPESRLVTEVVEEFADERTTGSDGHFTFRVADVCSCSLYATKDGYAAAAAGGTDWEVPPVEAVVRIGIALGHAHPVRLQVVDTTDRPIAGARVARYSGEVDRPPVAVVRTDEDGWFELSCAYQDVLVVRAAGHARCKVEEVLDRGEAPIVLTAPYALGGTVVDEAGEPIAGAAVWADTDPIPPRVTDARGRFHWNDVPLDDAQVELAAEVPGRLRGWAYVSPGRTDVRIVLKQPGVLAGRFVSLGSTLAGPVHLRIDGPGHFGHREVLPSPAFCVAGLPPGVLRVRGEVRRPIRALGKEHAVPVLRGAVEITRRPGSDLHGVEVRLAPVVVSYVVVRIVDPDGHPIAHAGHDVDAPYGGASSRRTNEQGLIWSARAVVPGTRTQVRGWQVVPVHNGSTTVHGEYVPVRTSAEPGAETVDVVLVADPAAEPAKARLTLYTERADGVSLPPDAAANWLVCVRGNVYGSNPKVQAPAPGGGRWRGELVVEAGVELDVLAWAGGCANRRYELPAIPAGEVRELVCRLKPESRVRGRLVSRAGRPVGFHAVRIAVRPSGERPVRSGIGAYDVGPDGRFAVERLAAGPARLSVTRVDGTLVTETAVVVPEAAVLDVGDVVVGSLLTLTGVVRDTRGRPLGGVRVEAFEPSARSPYARSSTHDDGRFALRASIRPGALLRASRRGFAPLYRRLVRDEQELVLQEPGTVIVESEAPPAHLTAWWLRAFEGGTGRALDSLGRGSSSGGGRRWTLQRLPVGPVRLELFGRDADGEAWRRERRVTVVSGETTTVRFDREE